MFSFSLVNTSAFFVHGALNYDHNSINATIKQLPSGQLVTQGIYSQVSRWLELDGILYFGTGLDPSNSYEVSIQNMGIGNALSVRNLDMIQVVQYVSSICPSSLPAKYVFEGLLPRPIQNHQGCLRVLSSEPLYERLFLPSWAFLIHANLVRLVLSPE
jgi:hypothetical protein